MYHFLNYLPDPALTNCLTDVGGQIRVLLVFNSYTVYVHVLLVYCINFFVD